MIALLATLAGWAIVTYGNAALGVVNPVLLPTPGAVAAVLVDAIRDGSLPRHVLTSLVRVAEGFGLALFVIVGAEFMGADAGLGYLIMEGRTFFNPAQIVLGALVLGLLGSLVNWLLLALERRIVPAQKGA